MRTHRDWRSLSHGAMLGLGSSMYRLALMLALLPAVGVSAQTQTLLDYECETTVTVTGTSPVTFLKDIVARADLIVRAGMGRGTSHLSDDVRTIYTTYALLSPRVLFGSGSSAQRVAPSSTGLLTIEQFGGTILKDGRQDCRLRMEDSGATILTLGMDVLCCWTKEWPHHTDGHGCLKFETLDHYPSQV